MQELEDHNYAWLIYLIMYGLLFQAFRLSVIKMFLPTELIDRIFSFLQGPGDTSAPKACSSALPAELIDRIFSFLQGDTSALKACSIAHPVYSRLAERYLYADLQISPFAVSGLHEQISKNPHLLDYPRTLQFFFDESVRSITMMSMIPRMSNLVSFTLCGHPVWHVLHQNFLSAFKNCLQQSAIQEVCLNNLSSIPLSVLDNGRNIRKLTLISCTATNDTRWGTGSPLQSLETLIIRHEYNDYLLCWALGRVTYLTSLELPYMMDQDDDDEWADIPALLGACSNSLTKLHLQLATFCMRYSISTVFSHLQAP
jgi:hypothetical protein